MAIFASGTVTFFNQTSAPTGWTKDVANFNNSALRVVSGSASSGGSVDLTTAFTTTPFVSAPFPVPDLGATTLSLENLPLHNHPVGPTLRFWGGYPSPITPQYKLAAPTNPVAVYLSTSGAAYSSTSTPGAGGAHTHNVDCTLTGSSGDLSVKYVDVIKCSKD